MRRFLAALLLAAAFVWSTGRPAVAADWAKAMFDHTTHDFGMVARGAEAEHRFKFENIYLEDVHIKSVSSSCQCTDVKVTCPSLKTYETAEVVAALNTRKFTGTKDATIRVVFDKPYPAEVQLHVHSYIRTDVVLEPGAVQFGKVTEGTPVTKEVILRHAGSPDWRITGYKNEDEHIDVDVRPVSSASNLATYRLTFALKPTAPAGYIRHQVTLITNDKNPNARQVLVPIEGVVSPTVSISPSPLSFGPIQAGQTSSPRRIVIQGQEPFQILELAAPDDRFSFPPPVKLNTSARLHLIPVVFAAGSEPGKIRGQILIRTDIGDGRILRVNVTGEVLGDSPTRDATEPVSDEAPESSSDTSSDGWRKIDD